jgi:hypothetical protein
MKLGDVAMHLLATIVNFITFVRLLMDSARVLGLFQKFYSTDNADCYTSAKEPP